MFSIFTVSLFLIIPTYISQMYRYLHISTNLFLHVYYYLTRMTYLSISSSILVTTYLYLQDFKSLPTYISRPTSTYPYLFAHLYLYIIAADPGAGIGLVLIRVTYLDGRNQLVVFVLSRSF